MRVTLGDEFNAWAFAIARDLKEFEASLDYILELNIGFMDGGLVFSGIMGKSFKYASYAGIVILLIASIIYPYILIH